MTQIKFDRDELLKKVHTLPFWAEAHKEIGDYIVTLRFIIARLEDQKEWLEKNLLKDKKFPDYEKIYDNHMDAYIESKGYPIEFNEKCIF